MWQDLFIIEHCHECHTTVCFWKVEREGEETFYFCSGNRFDIRSGCGNRIEKVKQPKRLYSVECEGCKQVVNMVLIYDERGQKKYECIGNAENRFNGCGRRAPFEKGGDNAKV